MINIILKYKIMNNFFQKAMFLLLAFLTGLTHAQVNQKLNSSSGREHLLMDFDWRFAFGHPFDANKDFMNGTAYFSYLTKAGNGDGAASKDFDDRVWRLVNLPHDWAVELPFDSKAGYSHGYKTVGRNYPETSVGWYRKTITIPESDLGKHITIEFDGEIKGKKVKIRKPYFKNTEKYFDEL